MSEHSNVVIVGRAWPAPKPPKRYAKGHSGAITLIGDEAELPYERPLSRRICKGPPISTDCSSMTSSGTPTTRWTCVSSCAVTAIDRPNHEVVLEGGERLHYDQLLLDRLVAEAPRHPRDRPRRVHYLRRIGDSDRLRAAFQGGAPVAIIGAGWIGLRPQRPPAAPIWA